MLITAAAPLLVRLYASTLDPATLRLSVTFAFICLPQIFFYGLYTVLGQVLNARGQFAAFFWAPVAANVVFIAGLVAFIVLYPVAAGGGGLHHADDLAAGRQRDPLHRRARA